MWDRFAMMTNKFKYHSNYLKSIENERKTIKIDEERDEMRQWEWLDNDNVSKIIDRSSTIRKMCLNIHMRKKTIKWDNASKKYIQECTIARFEKKHFFQFFQYILINFLLYHVLATTINAMQIHDSIQATRMIMCKWATIYYRFLIWWQFFNHAKFVSIVNDC